MTYSRVVQVDETQSTVVDIRDGALTSRHRELIDDLVRRFTRVHVVVDGTMLRRRDDVGVLLDRLVHTIPGSTVLALTGGERVKSYRTLERLIRWFDRNAVTRRSEVVVAIGGGALLDVTGLATALYRRGATLWRLPTTLLSAIDAGIGAKCAVNFFGRKNLVGTYRLPARVLVDPSVLTTLTAREVRSGLAEAVKLGLAADGALFDLVAEHGSTLVRCRLQSATGRHLVRTAIDSMVDELLTDLWEASLVHPTDLGHSFSRILEQELRPRVLHGEAVALDIALSAACSQVLGRCDDGHRRQIWRVLQSLGLPVTHADVNGALLERAYDDIVVHRDGNRFPLPIGPGRTEIHPLSRTDLLDAARLSADQPV